MLAAQPTIHVHGQGAFAALRPDPGVAVVSIVNPNDAYPPSLRDYGPTLRLTFSDVSDPALTAWERWIYSGHSLAHQQWQRAHRRRMGTARVVVPCTPWDAVQLRAFAEHSAVRSCSTLLIHCEYGRSRSVLAARAIHAWWDGRGIAAQQLDPEGALNARWARFLAAARPVSLTRPWYERWLHRGSPSTAPLANP